MIDLRSKNIDGRTQLKQLIDIDKYDIVSNEIELEFNNDQLILKIPCKEKLIKNFNYYVNEYFLVNPLKLVDIHYLETIKYEFLNERYGQINEYKLGLLKFICDDLGYSFKRILYEIDYNNAEFPSVCTRKIIELCPESFIKSIDIL